MYTPETPLEKTAVAVVLLLSLGCFSTEGTKLMPHLSDWSSENSCDPDGAGCDDADEVCVYNPYVHDTGGVDLNDYYSWKGSECGEAPDDEAVCVSRPDPADEEYPFDVCGCDGNTYETVAHAHNAGVSVDYWLPCRSLLPHFDEEASSKERCDWDGDGEGGRSSCPGGETCVLSPYESAHGDTRGATNCEEVEASDRVRADDRNLDREEFDPDGRAYCVVVEDGAADKDYPGDNSQVCGCDGNTYDSFAAAHAAGVSVSKKSPCDQSSGQDYCDSNDDCPPSEFCQLPEDEDCGQYANGTCNVPPDASDCPGEYDPVCGCDGTTYRNRCVAHANEVSVDTTGECAANQTDSP